MVRINDSLRAGVAIYNVGVYRAACGAWGSEWLSLERDTDDERFLHGLIQFTAAVHHAYDGNDSGATGLARNVREYLDDLADDYHGVNLAGARESLACLEVDPDVAAGLPVLRLDDRVVMYGDLNFDAVAVVAETFAEELDGYGKSVIADAVGYAHEEVADREQTWFTIIVFGFVRNETQRGLVFQRLSEHVRRRRCRGDDVSGLFD